MTLLARLAAALLLAVSAIPAPAQQYPSGPVTIVVPFAPGGTTDILGRLAGEVLQSEFKSGVVIDNAAGPLPENAGGGGAAAADRRRREMDDA
jgi:tripartite-type tricarboxylate transporter receptor subunit TctC